MKDYNQIFNEKLGEKLAHERADFLPTDVRKEFETHVTKLLQLRSFYSLSISAKEYETMIWAMGDNELVLMMSTVFTMINVLKAATPRDLGYTLHRYLELVRDIDKYAAMWDDAAATHIAAIQAEVNAEAKDDQEKETVRRKLSSGGHAGMAKQGIGKQIQLGKK